MKTKFVEVSKEELKHTTQEWVCEQCCLLGKGYACRTAKCKPHERCDRKRGYYVEDLGPVVDVLREIDQAIAEAEAEASLGTTKQITKEEWRNEFK